MTACPLCASRRTDEAFRLAGVPVHSTILLDDAASARAFARGGFRLHCCHDCGFVFNAAFDQRLIDYAGQFEESQHFSPTFTHFAQDLVEQLSARFTLAGERVVDVGCGRGEFLLALRRRTGCEGVGIDPGFSAARLAAGDDAGLRFLVEPLAADHSRLAASLVLCRHTLEHIADVNRFAALLRGTLAPKPDATLLCETPDAGRVLRDAAFWDLYYEHCSYFTEATHATLLQRQRLAVGQSDLVFGQQYILQFASAGGPALGPASLSGQRETVLGWAADLAARVAHDVDRWRSRLAALRARGGRAVLWGGGSKAVGFLSGLAADELVDSVVDINPFRQHRFLPGSGQRILPPAALRERPPDLVIVMNAIYRDEITSQLAAMDLVPEIATLG